MSQVNHPVMRGDQAVQVATHPEMQKPAVRREPDRWLHVPALVYMIVMTQIPFVLAVWFSLHAWNLLVPSEGFPFVGLSNYITVFFQDPNFWPVMGHTLELVVGAMVLAVIAGTILAVLLNRPLPGSNAVRALATWKNLFLSPSTGIFDWALHLVGLPKVAWFSSFPLESVTFIVAWEWTPFVMLVLLAGLQAIPDEVLEAAKVDGATALTTFWRVVVPLLRKPYEIALLFGTIFVFQTFGEIYLTTGGGPGIATNTLPYYTYRTALLSFQIGLAATLGVIGVIVAILAARGMLRVMTERS